MSESDRPCDRDSDRLNDRESDRPCDRESDRPFDRDSTSSSLSPEPSFHDADAHVHAIVKSFYDAQEAVRSMGESTEGVHALLVSMIDADRPFAIVDPSSFDLVYASGAFLRVTGYGPNDLRRAPLSTLYGPETNADDAAQTVTQIQSGLPAAARIVLYRKSGTAFSCSFHATPKFGSKGRVSFYLITLFDAEILSVPDPAIAAARRASNDHGVPRANDPKRTSDEKSSDDIVHRGTIRARNRIEEQMFLLVERCAVNRNLYWLMGYEFSRRDRGFLIPGLVFMSLASVFSAMQAAERTSREGDASVYYRYVEPYMILAFTLIGTVLTGVRAAYRYRERSEGCKSAGKMFGKIAARIDMNVQLFRTHADDPCTDARLETFAREIMAQVDNVIQDAPDVPIEKLTRDVRLSRHGHLVTGPTVPRFIRPKPSSNPVEKNVVEIV